MTETANHRLEDDEIDLRRYIEIIWRRKNVVLSITVAAAIVTLLLSLLTPRQWQAKSTIMVPEPPKGEQPQIVAGLQVTTPTLVYSQETYARLLRSTVILKRVIEKLGLRSTPEGLSNRLTVKPIRDTRLIDIFVKGGDPIEAEAVANTLADMLVEYDREVVSAEVTQARRFVEQQLVVARADLQAKELALKEFSQRENLTALETEVNRRLSQLSGLRQAYEQNRLDLGVASQRLAQLRRELAATTSLRPSSSSSQTNVLGSSVATQLRAKLADLESQRAILLERYPPSHPSVLAVDAQIAQTKHEIAKASGREPRFEEQRANTVREQLESQRSALEVEVAGLRAKDRLLAASIASEEAGWRQLNARLAERRAEFNRLTREVETAKSVYTTLTAKSTEAIVAEGVKSGFVRVVDRAGAQRVARGTVTKVSLAAILGLMAGTIAAFVAEHFGLPTQVPMPRRAGAIGTAPVRREELEV